MLPVDAIASATQHGKLRAKANGFDRALVFN